MSRYPHFSEEEFRLAVPSCEVDQMEPSFMEQIERMRSFSGVPMHINSAYRSKEYELSKGRSGLSYHTKGRAIDIRCKDSVTRYMLVSACMLFTSLSMVIHPTYIHFDDRPTSKVML